MDLGLDILAKFIGFIFKVAIPVLAVVLVGIGMLIGHYIWR